MHLALIGFTGSRLWPDPQLLEDTLMDTWHDALQLGYDGIELTHGDADGADTICDTWAKRHGVPVHALPADWEGPCGPECQPGHRRRKRSGRTYCPLAGHRRNQQIVNRRPVLMVAASYRNSRGTADCMRRAKAAGIPVRLITA